MLKKKMFLVAATALMTFSLAACNSTTQGGSDQDYEQSDTTGSDLVVSVIGDATHSGWDGTNTSKDPLCLFTKIDSKHYQLKNFVPIVGKQFKLHQGTDWKSQYGVEDMDWTKSTGIADLLGADKKAADYTAPADNRSSFVVAKAGKATIDFYPYYFLDTTVSTNFLVVSFVAD